jgi:hypothetical protein
MQNMGNWPPIVAMGREIGKMGKGKIRHGVKVG